jgi:DNA ligase-1
LDFKPQQAKKADSVAEAIKKCSDPTMELKYDGWRLIVIVTENGPTLWSRAGKEYTGRIPEIEEKLGRLPVGTILDGEIVDLETHDYISVTNVFGGKGLKDKDKRDKLTYVAFDIIEHDYQDHTTEPLTIRRDILGSALGTVGITTAQDRIQVSKTYDCTDDQFQEFLEQGFEGAVVKDLAMPYMKGKRGHGWFKLKGVEEIDVVIMELPHDGKGKYFGLVGKMTVGQYNHLGELVPVANVNCPDDAQRIDMTHNPEKYIGRVFEMKHYGKIVDGYRHPNWVRWREDKLAEECLTDDQN